MKMFLRTALTIAALCVATTLGTATVASGHPVPPGGAPECPPVPSAGNPGFGYDRSPAPPQAGCPTEQPSKPPVHPGPSSVPCPTTPPESPTPQPPATTPTTTPSSTTPSTTTPATTTSSTTPVVPVGNSTPGSPAELANTGFENSFLGWVAALLLLGGGSLLILLRVRRKS